MARAITFDTHSHIKRLMTVGFTEEQAEVQTQAIAQLVEEHLATKQDLKELELRLTIRLGSMMVIAIGIIATLVKVL